MACGRRLLFTAPTPRRQAMVLDMRVDSPRPSQPDGAILEAAAAAAGVDAGLDQRSWLVGPRMDRPQATLFPLRLVVDGSTVLRAFYKTHRVHARTAGVAASKAATFHRVLSRGPGLSAQYARLSTGIPVAMPAFLAADVDTLTEVQTAIPGRPVSRVVLHSSPPRRARALRSYRALGAAIAVIEQCRDHGLAGEQPPQLALDILAHSLSRAMTPPDIRRLHGLLAELQADASARGELSYSHGDLGRGNFFITRQGAGLIDALWSVRWRGDDLAYHAVRLRHELPRLPSWTSRLVAEMLAGYGDEHLPERPEWLLTQLWFEARVAAVHPRQPIDAFQRWQAVSRIRAALGASPR
jgi:hypothetical protein